MNEATKLVIRNVYALKNNLIVWKATGKKVKRFRVGWIKVNGVLRRTSDIIAVLLTDMADRRRTISFDMARTSPELVLSKVEAEAAGLKLFRTGKLCVNGHDSWRFVSSGGCVKCKGLLPDAYNFDHEPQ